jgi:hypothetical protein
MKLMQYWSKLFEVVIETVSYKWGSVLTTILDPDQEPTNNSTSAFEHTGFGEGVKINPALELKFYLKDDDGGADSTEKENTGNLDEKTVNDKVR